MRTDGVPWRRVAVGLGAAAVALSGTVVALRSDGFTATDATVPRATRWFVHQATGRVVLADGFSGRALARLEVTPEGDEGRILEVTQSAGGAAVIDRSSAEARAIDQAALRLGPPQQLALAAKSTTIVAAVQNGIVAADPESGDAVLLPSTGDPVPFELGPAGPDEATRVAPDGSVWTVAGSTYSRVNTQDRDTLDTRLGEARATLVGNVGMVYDGSEQRVRLASGDWVELDTDTDPSEVVLQEPGPPAECGWIGFGDELRCIGDRGVVHSVTVEGLDLGGGDDRLAIAGDAAAIVRASTNTIVTFDWRTGELRQHTADVRPLAQLEVTSAIDLVWIDDTEGDQVWAVHPWGLHPISKNDDRTPLLGESGEVLEEGSGGDADTSPGDGQDAPPPEREPDDNGIDDPPEAVDDPVTARTGASVAVPVTANDYDPDGEAVALIAVGEAHRGTVEIGSATTAVYRPEPGYVGDDRFEYTITDAAGHTDTATVTIELLPTDAPNNPPVASADFAQTGTDAAVEVDVLLNDVDPERDALRIDSFTAEADIGGQVTETISASGFPALQYVPPPGESGTARFSYRPLDAYGAVGEPATVTVEIAAASDLNRKPITKPDAIQVRRNLPVSVPVLANDRDPDGDPMTLGVVEPLAPGLEVTVAGDELRVVARPGAEPLVPFAYTVDDGHDDGEPSIGHVLVVVADDTQPNQAPIANADSATAVAGTAQLIDVLLNDSDPDGDPLVLTSASPDPTVATPGSVRVQGDRVQYTPAPLGTRDEPTVDRFTYVITDGNGHEATGSVTVRVLPEALRVPPFARDDSATTTVDVPVTIDVLRNDGDPSGERPDLLGRPGCAGGGTVEVTSDSRVTFTPPPGEDGVFRCTYEVVNSQALSDQAVIIVSVLEPPTANVAPVVVDDQVTVEVGETVDIRVLDNDSDPDGPHEQLRVVSWNAPTVGTAVREGSTIVYTAPANPITVSMSYQVGDQFGGISTGHVVIRVVDPVPVPPTAAPDRRTIVGPGSPQEIDVLFNDTDPDGDPGALAVQAADVISGDGTATIGNREVLLAPDPAFVGDLVASYTVVDPDGLTDTETVTLTVTEAPNRPPVAVADAASVVNGGTVTLRLGANDSDPDGDPLTFNLLSAPDPALGSVTLDGDDLRFDANPGASGVAVATYEIFDGEAFASAEVRIAVQACAVAPPDAPDRFFETGYQQPIAIDLTAIASNGEVVDVSPPLGAPAGVYTPPAGENGNVVITYAVLNSCGIRDVGRVTIDVNQAPAAAPVVLQLGRHEQRAIPVSGLASDDEALTISGLAGQPEWVTVADAGQTLLLSPAGRSGAYAFTVVVADPGGLTTQVPVTVELSNLAPIAQPDGFDLPMGPLEVRPLANDSDPDGDAITINSVPGSITFPNGATGTVQVLATGSLRIDPGDGAGTAAFDYTITDALGAVSAPATITVTVNAAPSAPLVEVQVPWLGETTVAIPATDPDGDPLVATVRPEDVPEGFLITTDGLDVTVSNLAPPSANTYDVPYTVTDPDGRTATNILRIVVGPPPTTTTTTTPPPTTTTTPTTPTTDPGPAGDPGPPGEPGPPSDRP